MFFVIALTAFCMLAGPKVASVVSPQPIAYEETVTQEGKKRFVPVYAEQKPIFNEEARSEGFIDLNEGS